MKTKLISWKRIYIYIYIFALWSNDWKTRPTPQSFFFLKLFLHLADSQPQPPATKIKLYLLLYLCINISFELEAAIAIASLVAQMIKRLPTMWETRVQSLGWEDLEKEMATHSSTLAWKIPWTEEPGRLQSMGSQRVGHNWATSLSLSLLILFCPVGRIMS